LVLVTLLGLVASNNPAVRHQVLEAVAHQVPIIGDQLTGSVQQLRRSSIIGLIVGLIVLTWGATSLAQAGLFTMEQVWNLPGPARPGYFQRLGRAVVFLAVLGFGVVVTTGLTSLGLYGHGPGLLDVAGEILVTAANIGMFFLSFRVLTPKGVPTPQAGARRGCRWAGVDRAAGTGHVCRGPPPGNRRSLRRVRHRAGAAGLDLPQRGNHRIRRRAQRRAGPKAVATLHRPAPLTEADRAVLAVQTLQNQRRDDQCIHVSYDDLPRHAATTADFPRTPDEIAPPAAPNSGSQAD
jgi:hypothetical protein